MIIVLGSINLDLTGRVDRLPAPGETRLGSTFAMAPGGKGANQALAARRAGAKVRLHGATGKDQFGTEALALLKADGVDLDGVTAIETATGVAMILVEGTGENAIVVLAGANARLGAMDAETALKGLGDGDTLMVQQEIGQAATRHALELARAKGIRTIFNTAPFLDDTAELAREADVIVANKTEFGQLAGVGGTDGAANLERQMRHWASAERRTLIVTLGGEGARAATPERFISVAPYPITPLDTVGAGDTFCGYLAAGLDQGLALEAALRRAVVAGALACLKPGAQPAIPYANDVDAAARSGAR